MRAARQHHPTTTFREFDRSPARCVTGAASMGRSMSCRGATWRHRRGVGPVTLSPSSSYHMQIGAASRMKAGSLGNNDTIDTATLKKSLLRGPDRRVPPRLVALSTAATTAASFECNIQSWRRMSTGNENFHIEISPGDIFRWMQSLWRRRLRDAINMWIKIRSEWHSHFQLRFVSGHFCSQVTS
jgi:hypothetical protein